MKTYKSISHWGLFPVENEKERIKREMIHNQASILLKVYSHKQQLLNIEV